MKTNKREVKILAAVLVLAVVVAGFAIVSEDIDSAPNTSTDLVYTISDSSSETPTTIATGATYVGSTDTLTLDGYNGTKGFYFNGNLTIVVSGTNTITLNRASTDTIKGYDVAAIYTTGTLTIQKDSNNSEDDILNITMTGKSSASSGSEHTYGIYAGGAIAVSNIELNMSISLDDKYAFAVTNGCTDTIGFSNVTGEIAGGNRAIQTTGKVVTFTDSTMTLKGGEKAIQAKDANGGIVLAESSTGSNITLELIDCPGSNTGVDDRFGAKTNALTVSAKSTLTTQGLRITGTASAPAGKVIVSGGYEQNSKEIYDVAGLYLDTNSNSLVAKTGTATAGYFTVTSDAETYNIAIEGKSEVSSITQGSTASAYNTTIETALTNSASNDVQLNIPNPSGGTGDEKKITISDLKGKNVTLNVAASSSNITAIEVTIKGQESISVLAQSGITYTFKNGTTNTLSVSSFTGSIIATPGSVDIQIDGAGTLTVSGDGKVSGTVTGATGISSASGTVADVDLSGVTIASGTLTLSGINVKSNEYIQNNGNITFTNTTIDGSIFIDGGEIQGTFDKGNIVLKGTVTVKDDSTITSSAKMNITKGSTVAITSSKTLTNGGTINLSGTIENTVSTYGKLTNNGKIVLLDKDAVIKDISTDSQYDGTGVIDTSSIASDVQISGDVETVTEYGLYQTVTITGDTNLIKGARITINGILIIQDGVTLTIEDGAQLCIVGAAASVQNDGSIIIESDVTTSDKMKTGIAFAVASGLNLGSGSVFENNGSIILNYIPAGSENNAVMTVSTTKFTNNGTVTVMERNKISNSGAPLINGSEATMTVYGTVSNDIKNSGTVVLSGDVNKISNVADGAVASVIQFTGDTLTIDDDGFKYGTTTPSGTNSILITKNNADSVGTFTAVSDVTKTTSNGSTVYGKKLSISGTLSEAYTTGASHASVGLSGTINVSDELTVTENVNVTGGTLKVSGTVSVKNGNQITVNTLTVTGMVITGDNPVSATTVNAAMYKVVVVSPASITFYYTTLDQAIAGAAEASVTEVTATGDVSVKADITIPSGLTVKQTNGKITVGSSTATDVTMTVAQGGKINQTSGTIDVKGTLYITDKKTGINKGATVTCEVISEGETDLRYTNLNSAIAAAGSDPVTITLNGNTTITSDTTIPENVTIDMNGKKFTVEGAKLIIDGILYVDVVSNYDVKNVTSATSITSEGKVILNGYIISDDPISYSASTAKSPAGVYYIADSMNIITSIENIAEAVLDSDDNAVSVYGENKTSDIAISGTSDEPVTVTVFGNLTVGKIAIDFATIILKQNIEMNGTISGANGSIAFSDVKISTDTKMIANENSSEVKVLTVDSGSVTYISDNKKTYALVMDGDVTVKALYLDAVDVTGMNIYSLIVDGNVKVTGSSNDLKKVLVNGTLTADNGVNVVASQIDVLGTLAAEKATETKTAGTVNVAGSIIVGSKLADIGESATVTGAVSFYTLFVLDGNNVDESVVKDLSSTTFYVEGAIWMTAYASASATSAQIADIDSVDQIPIEDAFFGGVWVADLTDPSAVAIATDVGSVNAVYAKIVYDVYNITVVGDNGIGTVSIDGNLLVKNAGSGENVFTLPGTNTLLKAGAHEITYELKDGYTGTIKIKVDGKEISGKNFSLSGTPTADGSGDMVPIDVTIDISGSIQKDPVTPTPEPTPIQPSEKDDSMGITEYLLIVLVILAAILVVVVAIRMMRS